jgi:hypothetical protein
MEEEERRSETEPKRQRRSPEQAVRLSARAAFIICELYKVRHMTLGQVARLIVVKDKGEAALSACRRMRSLGHVEMSDPFLDRRKLVVSLTEKGRRFAIERLGRRERAAASHDPTSDFVMHSLRGAELYTRLVTDGAADWLAAMANADKFSWYASNEGVDFSWRPARELPGQKAPNRKLIPDAVIETESLRLLVEVERSTKTLRGVMAKVESYNDIFSPLKSADDRAAYHAKYRDELEPIVVFLFDSNERAENVAKLVEERKRGQNFRVPALRTFGLEGAVAFLRERIGLGGAPAAKPVSPKYDREMMRFFLDLYKNPRISPLSWPPNWRTVTPCVFTPQMWEILGPKLNAQLSEATRRAREGER